MSTVAQTTDRFMGPLSQVRWLRPAGIENPARLTSASSEADPGYERRLSGKRASRARTTARARLSTPSLP